MLTAPQNPASRLATLRQRIARACHQAGRDPGAVTLIGVAKGQSLERVQAAIAAGLGDIGENYLQEAERRRTELAGQPLCWHFIGALQANKTRAVAESYDWVHSVDRLRIAERLSAQRPATATPLQVCLQLRLADESAKSGIEPAGLPALAASVAQLPRLQLRGLMLLPPEEADAARQRHWFAALRQQFEMLRARGHSLDVLSMGMSSDFESAIAEGATHLRVGSALFGDRDPPPPAATTLAT